MKSSDRSVIYGDLNKEPRETQYEVEIFIKTDNGLEPFDAFLADRPPQLPDVGDNMKFSWIEDENENEVTSPVDPHDIGTDEEFTEVNSHELKVAKKSTTYSKRNYKDENEARRILIVEKAVVLEQY